MNNSVKIIGKIDLFKCKSCTLPCANATPNKIVSHCRDYVNLDPMPQPSDVTIDKLFDGRNHKFTIKRGIPKRVALQLQMELAYHPAGYGFYGFDATATQTTWCCYGNCD